ncbi:hypothetical protein O0I10_013252 [Lichtheimia ornata]|uniref:Uncharacterized protein n=1 Tax=Lichtheimia ornata TaxID=688661 RepID=A0AAD7US43_9FUNG|nr:uncharacterized protein O0I10_013252 [Lichtheimia ornata]KAJ8651266.1 hypothetical protein O0I10_013252 [Lichtheimia ornata]
MRVLKTSSHCLFWVNMLDGGISGSNKTLVSKQECCMVGSMEWIVSATSNSIHIKLYPIIWFSRYRQFGGRPEMKFSYRLITSAARNNLYIFDISNLSISWWFWLSAIPLMDFYNYTCLMDGSCHQQAMRARVQIFCVTKVIHASRQGLHRQAAFHTQ